MKNIFKIFFLPLLFSTILTLFPNDTQAAEFHFKSYTLEQEETINDDVYALGDTVVIDGVINGDLIAMAEVVKVTGTVSGDVYLFGSKVNIDANVYGNTFIFGNTVTTDGIVTENTYIGATFLTYLGSTEKDLSAFFMEGSLKGSVGDDLRAFAFRPDVESVVSGDMILLGEEYTASEDKISGNIYYNSTLETIANEQGVNTNTEIEINPPTFRRTLGLRASRAFVSFVSTLIVGFVIITLTPVKTAQIMHKITDSTGDFLKSLGIGFAIFFLVPVPLFLLFITVIGAPLAIFISGVLIFFVIFGRIWVEMALGREILELAGIEEYRPFKSFLVGRALTTVVRFIPLLRGFYNSILTFVALGAIVRVKMDFYQIAKEQGKKATKKKKSKKKKTSKKKKKE